MLQSCLCDCCLQLNKPIQLVRMQKTILKQIAFFSFVCSKVKATNKTKRNETICLTYSFEQQQQK